MMGDAVHRKPLRWQGESGRRALLLEDCVDYASRMTERRPGEHWAAGRSRELLQPLGDRWLHVLGVGRRAEVVACCLPEQERELLIAAAYLHDIGYAPELRRTGLHQLDGAYYVRTFAEDRVVRLVANHSEARFEVGLSGWSDALAEFPREEAAVADALTYCDLTTSPVGAPIRPRDRIAEVATRYESDGVVMQALQMATPHLLAAVERTRARLHDQGLVAREG